MTRTKTETPPHYYSQSNPNVDQYPVCIQQTSCAPPHMTEFQVHAYTRSITPVLSPWHALLTNHFLLTVRNSLTGDNIHVANVTVGDSSTPDRKTKLIIQGPLAPSFCYGGRKLLLVTHVQMINKGQISINNRSRLIMDSEKPEIDIRALFERHSPWFHRMDIHGMNTDSILQNLFDSNMVPTMTLSRLEHLISQDRVGYHQASVTVQISRFKFTPLWLRKRLFYSYCTVCSKIRYSNRYYDYGDEPCHLEMAMFGARVNPHLFGRMWDWSRGFSWPSDTGLTDLGNDETWEVPDEQARILSFKSPLLITNRAFLGLVGCRPTNLANNLGYNMGEKQARRKLMSLEKSLEWTKVDVRLGWFSMDAPHLKRMNTGESALPSDRESTPVTEEEVSGQLVLLDVKPVTGKTDGLLFTKDKPDWR